MHPTARDDASHPDVDDVTTQENRQQKLGYLENSANSVKSQRIRRYSRWGERWIEIVEKYKTENDRMV